MKNKRKNNIFLGRAGFSFTEIVMAIMILATVAVYLATAIPGAYLITHQTQEITTASDLAQKYMENVKIFAESNYDSLIEGTTPPVTVTSEYTNNGKYDVSVNTEDLSTDTITVINSATNALQDITVVALKRITITYTKSGIATPLISISAEIARPRD